MRRDRSMTAVLLAAAFFSLSSSAFAFCRTRTATGAPGPSGCIEAGHPIYWKSACVGYHMNQAASKQVSLPDASSIMAGAFAGWVSGNGACFPSISVTALAPTASSKIGYDMMGPNENIVFFDDDGTDPALDSTILENPTVTFNAETGEILDVDIVINSHDQSFIVEDEADSGDGYDLRYVLTHAAGHFLGLAHSTIEGAVMRPIAVPGPQPRPWIKDDDAQGLCAIYPQNGTRTTTDASGNATAVPASACNLVAETPCSGTVDVSHGCSIRPLAKRSSSGFAGALLVALALLWRARFLLVASRPIPRARAYQK